VITDHAFTAAKMSPAP